MRVVFTIFFLLPLLLFAQTNFTKQLDDIIKDSSNSFKSFKSNFKETRFTEATPDSIFFTKLSLDGTSNNELLVSSDESIYMADVADSLNDADGKKIVDEWKTRIVYVLANNGFTIEKVRRTDGTPSKYGWDFSKGNVTINIGLFPHKKNSNVNWIGLAVSVVESENTGLAGKND